MNGGKKQGTRVQFEHWALRRIERDEERLLQEMQHGAIEAPNCFGDDRDLGDSDWARGFAAGGSGCPRPVDHQMRRNEQLLYGDRIVPRHTEEWEWPDQPRRASPGARQVKRKSDEALGEVAA